MKGKTNKVILLTFLSIAILTGCSGEKNNETSTKATSSVSVENTVNTLSSSTNTQENVEGKNEVSNQTNEDANTNSSTQIETILAPDFTLQDRNGNSFTLSDQIGKKVYVKFWASWCHVCLTGIDELEELSGKDNGFEVITIVAPNISGEKSKEDFIKWFDQRGYKNIKVLFDETGVVMANYGITAFPTSVAIDSKGNLAGIQAGHIQNEPLIEAFKTIQ